MQEFVSHQQNYKNKNRKNWAYLHTLQVLCACGPVLQASRVPCCAGTQGLAATVALHTSVTFIHDIPPVSQVIPQANNISDNYHDNFFF